MALLSLPSGTLLFTEFATVLPTWNFHVSVLLLLDLFLTADIMGYANALIEQQTGSLALFVNADAGDIDPADVCFYGCHF